MLLSFKELALLSRLLIPFCIFFFFLKNVIKCSFFQVGDLPFQLFEFFLYFFLVLIFFFFLNKVKRRMTNRKSKYIAKLIDLNR